MLSDEFWVKSCVTNYHREVEQIYEVRKATCVKHTGGFSVAKRTETCYTMPGQTEKGLQSHGSCNPNTYS